MELVLVQRRSGGFKALTAITATLLALGAAGCGDRADQADDRKPASGGATAAVQVPTKPEPGTLKLGTQPWIGYGPFTLAKENGLFDREQLSVEISTFKEDKQINAALASGRLDAVNAGTIQALTFAAAGLPVKIVMLEDVSAEADAILAKSEIASIAELKGKRVAYEEGTTGEVLLRYALQ